ncbi:MAG: hypothetical protein U7M05_06525, partial [Candidatus Igneacidithiobacillus chanchocoensis]
MASYSLFRLKLIEGNQKQIFGENISRKQFFEILLQKKPSYEIRKGQIWHIGNVADREDGGLVFAVGKTTKAGKEKYDEKSGDFLEVLDEESPFTYVFYASDIGALAIAQKRKLAPNSSIIAKNIEKILNANFYTIDNSISVKIEEIADPRSFVDQLYDAYAVVIFAMEFGEP